MITTSRDGPVGRIILARPEKRNALNNREYERLADALRQLDAGPEVAALTITGKGAAFCGGTDLAELETEWPQAPDGPVMGLLHALVALDKPLIAAVNGPAVGIGATMLLHCDWVIMAPDAWMRFPFAELGIAPEGGATRLLPARIGRLRAVELLFTGRRIGSEEAMSLGLATSVSPDPDVEARAVASKIAALSREAVAALKFGLREACGDDGTFWRELSEINRLLQRRPRVHPLPLVRDRGCPVRSER